MLPESDLPLRLVDHVAYPDFLGPHDEPWVRVLLDEAVRFEGRRRRELCERLAEPLPCAAPLYKRRAITRVLLRLWRREQVAAVDPIVARSWLFEASARGGPREARLAEVAAVLGVLPDALEQALFADLPGERIVRAPDPVPTAGELVSRTNLAIAQAVVMRAGRVDLRLEGRSRPVVRLAKLQGLLCTVRMEDAGPVLEVSGPFSLFRHTLLYGRALAALVPTLAWTARYRLRAVCRLRGRLVDVTLESGAPIVPSGPPPAFDSRLEERFARDFTRAAPDWDVVREPEPVAAGGTLVFPDFLLRHRLDPARQAFVEIVGFWTPDYLEKKLALLAEARIANLILCVDEERACGEGALPVGATIVGFRRRVDVARVIAALPG